MLRYALYARKSKDDKSEVIKSTRDQLEYWRKLATDLSLDIQEEYEENKSAKTPGIRPIYNEMIGRIKRGEIDGILVWHINRLARNMEEAGTLAQMLIEGKVKEIRTPHSIYKPGDNILMLLLEQGMSAQYSIDLAERVTLGINSMVEDGGWPHFAKLGYLNQRDPYNAKRGIIVEDPERWELTRRGFELMLSGAYTVRAAIDTMNSWGLQTRPTPTRPGGPLSYALGYDIFSNPFYAGLTRHNGVLRRGKHKPMITAGEYSRLQEIVEERTRMRRRTHEFIYTWMMKCGRCGMQITAERHVKGEKTYVYYHCSDTYRHCTKQGISEVDLEREIARYLENITVHPELCDMAIQEIARWQNGQSGNAEEVLNEQNARLQALETQRDNLLNMMLTGLLSDPDVYKQKEAALVAERNILQMEIQRSLDDLEHIRSQARAGFNYVRMAHDMFLVADRRQKKEIAHALGIEYVLNGRELSISIHPLLKEIVKFSDEIMVRFEPSLAGSENQIRASFKVSSYDGRGTRTLFELPESLISALRGPKYPDLFAYCSSRRCF